MEARRTGVKQKRSYDSSRRQERAAAAHAAMLDSAREIFLAQGYAATTVEEIAGRGGLSAGTVYKSYGGKPGVVRALVQLALEGAGSIPAEQRSDLLQRELSDPRQLIDAWSRLSIEVAPRVAPIMLLLKEVAATDSTASELLDEIEQARLDRMGHNAQTLASGGHLRAGVTWEEARDVLWIHTSAELFDLLVHRRRWTLEQYAEFIARSMTALLL
jgi:AcrR family transcriptional regulator